MREFHELLLPLELREAEALLRQAGLDMPEGVDFALGVYEDKALIGTGFLAGPTLCGICVSPEHQGEGLAVTVVDRLIRHGLEAGLSRLLLFTTPAEAAKFADLGFALVAQTREAAFLEWGRPDCAAWLNGVRAELATWREDAPGSASRRADVPDHSASCLGAVVMNANPFTLGHRHLVEQALARCPFVAVFVVEEDASVFPLSVRLELVRAGLADLARACVLPGGPYMVSRASFPAYFTGRSAHGRVHAELDATLFATRIAPALGIGCRFVGTEPICAVTALYNETLQRVLPAHGIACVEVERLERNRVVVSASAVREAVRTGVTPEQSGQLSGLVPDTTLAYLQSPQAGPVLRKLLESSGRH